MWNNKPDFSVNTACHGATLIRRLKINLIINLDDLKAHLMEVSDRGQKYIMF